MNSAFVHGFEVPLRLVLAIVAGAVIGLNRWFYHKPAGPGTHGLVALGAALASTFASRTSGADAAAASRVIQGVVTGVGFIGAGAIMRENQGQDAHGLTTAASIWISAIVGIACMLPDFVIAVTSLLLTLLVLFVGKPIEERLERIVRHQDNSGVQDQRRQSA